MKTILILGAGRSSSSLITYLLKEANSNLFTVVVGDLSVEAAMERVSGFSTGKAIRFDIHDAASETEVANADIVVSLLPAHFHPLVAKLCLKFQKHLITASYVSNDMQALHQEANEKGLLFLNECGLDPGIDHMSAVQVMDKIKQKGGVLTSFESFTGGLIAPETDPGNPWRYKFTWNPRNVVMAGQGTASFLLDGQHKYIPYQQLFQRITKVHVPGYGNYEGYANRDSMKYIETYGLQGIKTMLRGTLRNEGFCSAWNVLVQLGCCDDSHALQSVGSMTHKGFIDSFLDIQVGQSTEEKLCKVFGLKPDGPELVRLKWSELFSDELVGLKEGTPAQVLEHIMNKKWKLNSNDKDLIVMWHRFVYEYQGSKKEIQASLIAKGDDSTFTAMAKTVGLPLGIAAKLLITGKISKRGVAIPTLPEFYDPILKDLKALGVELQETEF